MENCELSFPILPGAHLIILPEKIILMKKLKKWKEFLLIFIPKYSK